MYALEGSEAYLDHFNYLTLQFPLLIHPVYNIIRLCNSYNNKEEEEVHFELSAAQNIAQF